MTLWPLQSRVHPDQPECSLPTQRHSVANDAVAEESEMTTLVEPAFTCPLYDVHMPGLAVWVNGNEDFYMRLRKLFSAKISTAATLPLCSFLPALYGQVPSIEAPKRASATTGDRVVHER